MITKEQATTADEFHVGECRRNVGKRGGVTYHIQTWRRNGATKFWKTRPEDFRIPVKYGLYAYASITHNGMGTFTHEEVHVPDDCPLWDLPCDECGPPTHTRGYHKS